MALRSVIPGRELENVKDDKKSAIGIEQYMVSERAVYSSGGYLPLSAVTGLKVQLSSYTPSCSCGKGIPVYKVRIDYGMDKPMVLMIEKEKNLGKLLSVIAGSRPDIEIERADLM